MMIISPHINQLGEIIDGMRTKANNNVMIKSSTMDEFAKELSHLHSSLTLASLKDKNIREDQIEKAFMLIFEAYNKPADTFGDSAG